MKKTKVFISSVIGGYEDRRGAAEEATIELNRDRGLNFEAIRTESNKHPAEDKSSQKVCRDGVKECDVYLGIYPKNNYGCVKSPGGISSTHEEFKEACEYGKQRLIFVENTKEIDPRQSEFLKEVGEYVDGRFWNEFDFNELDRLKHQVYRALLKLMESNFEDCLPNYLKSLLCKYELIDVPWNKDVHSLPVSEVVQLELREKPRKEDQKFSDAIKKKPRLLVIGNPGAGKSTALQWITYSYAKQILNHFQEGVPVPIYLQLKWYNNSLLKLIATYFGKNDVVCDEETIRDWIKKEQFLFLLDGFDELSDPSKCLKDVNDLIGFSGKARFVVTSRKIEDLKDFKSLEFEEVKVKQLSNSQMEIFIERYLGKEGGSRLFKELKVHNLLTEARNPLTLWLMTLECQEDESRISINKGMLFKSVIERRFLGKWDEKVIPAELERQKYTDLKIKVLSRLAFSMIEVGDLIKIKEDQVKKIVDDFLKEGRTNYKDIRDEILRQLFASRFLIKVGEQVSFWHKSFRDYFAALEIVEIFTREPEEFVNQYVTERWEGSILFFVGIMDVPSDFVDRLIQPFWQYFFIFWTFRYQGIFRLSLAAKCIGANDRISTKTQKKVIEQLTRITQIRESEDESWVSRQLLLFPVYYEYEKAFQALGETKSEKVAECLGEFLENSNSDYLCQCAVKALWNMPLTDKAQNSLLHAALWHKDEVVRYDAADILRDAMSQEIVSKLVKIVLDKGKDAEIRKFAIYILDVAKYPNIVIGPLIQTALRDKDVSGRAASALRSYVREDEDEEEVIINPLIHALHENPDPDIRANAAYALAVTFSKKNKKALIRALKDENPKVVFHVAYYLSWSGRTFQEAEEASRELFKLFNHTDVDVRKNAVRSYGIICGTPYEEELFQLTKLLNDENSSIRQYAAEALGNLKAECALNQLKEMIEVEEDSFSWASAIWAISQIEPSFSEVIKENYWEYPFIVMVLKDDTETESRKYALKILEKIGTERSLLFLRELKKDRYPEKRRGIDNELYYAITYIEEKIKRINDYHAKSPR